MREVDAIGIVDPGASQAITHAKGGVFKLDDHHLRQQIENRGWIQQMTRRWWKAGAWLSGCLPRSAQLGRAGCRGMLLRQAEPILVQSIDLRCDLQHVLGEAI